MATNSQRICSGKKLSAEAKNLPAGSSVPSNSSSVSPPAQQACGKALAEAPACPAELPGSFLFMS